MAGQTHHETRFWADEEADLLDPAAAHVIRDSKTPSGAVPISGLRGPIITDALYRTFKKRGLKIRYVFTIDDYDPMDSQSLKDNAAWREHMGKPFANIPSPEPSVASDFARYHASAYLATFDLLGIRPARPAGPVDWAGYDWTGFIRLVRDLDRKLDFVGLRYVATKVLNAHNCGLTDRAQKQELLNRAIDDGIIVPYRVDNIEEGGDPVSACRLNPENDVVRETLARLETDGTGREVTRVNVERNGMKEVYSANVVVVSAGAINSSALLLRSDTCFCPPTLLVERSRVPPVISGASARGSSQQRGRFRSRAENLGQVVGHGLGECAR